MADRRIIAIAVTPKAYDEIQKLKGDRTWTGYVIELALLENPQNQVLTDELANLPKKERKAAKSEKVEKAEAETKVPSAEEAERVEVEGEGTLIMPHTHKSKKAEAPTEEREPTSGISTPTKRQPKKGKTLQQLQAVNKGGG